ncbi:HAD family hydrolase [Rhizobium sp.]
MTSGRLMIFDCDGVLVDSEPLAAIAYVRVYARHGLAITTDIIAQCVGMKQADIFARIEQLTGHAFPQDHADDIWAETRAVFTEQLQPVPGIADFLTRLDAPRCVASSSSVERILHSLTLTGLLGQFGDAIFSSSMVSRGKPAPDLFLFAAEKMGFEPANCVVIEDSPFGVQGAVAAGMTVVGFTGGGHTTPQHGAQLRAAGAHRVLDSWKAVAEVFAGEMKQTVG